MIYRVNLTVIYIYYFFANGNAAVSAFLPFITLTGRYFQTKRLQMLFLKQINIDLIEN